MRLEENWGIAPERAAAFFREQADVQEEAGTFRFRSCAISLHPVAGQAMGRWALPRTRVVFDGPEEELRAIHRRFFLRFLSAGG